MGRIASHSMRLLRAPSNLALNASWERDIHSFSGHYYYYYYFFNITTWIKILLLISNLNLPSSSWKPFSLVLSLPDNVKSLFISFLQALKGHDEISLEPSPNWSSLAPFTFLHKRDAPAILFPLVALLWIYSSNSKSFLCWSSQAWMECCLHVERYEGRGWQSPLSPCQPPHFPFRIHTAFWNTSAHYLFSSSFLSTRIPTLLWRSPSPQGYFQGVLLSDCAHNLTAPTQVQRLALTLLNIPMGSLFKSAQVLVGGIPSFYSINFTGQLGVISKVAGNILDPTF